MTLSALDIDKFTIAWIVWILWFLFWETWAMIERDEPETFSEHIWALRNTGSFGKVMISALAVWLAWHFVFEGRG